MVVFSGIGCLLLAGCSAGSSDVTLYDVSGTVSYNGKPVPFGSVLFIADADEGNAGPQGVAEINDGKFNTAEAGRGVVGGAYKVIIKGRSVRASAEDDEGQGAEPLFADYQTAVVFPEENTEQKFEVPERQSKPGVILEE
ncbi:hypothetical protein [Gimesia alba]|nr:hypothetical protein [Gimesia alba]